MVDVGFALETDEELSFDTLAPRRNGATLAVLEDADLILAVGSADPIGIQRLVRGLGELRAAAIDTPVWIVLNRVRRSAVPGKPEVELNAALQRFVGQSCAALLPYDLTGLDQAAVGGADAGRGGAGQPAARARSPSWPVRSAAFRRPAPGQASQVACTCRLAGAGRAAGPARSSPPALASEGVLATWQTG